MGRPFLVAEQKAEAAAAAASENVQGPVRKKNWRLLKEEVDPLYEFPRDAAERCEKTQRGSLETDLKAHRLLLATSLYWKCKWLRRVDASIENGRGRGTNLGRSDWHLS